MKSIWTKNLKVLVFMQACASCLTPSLFLLTGLIGADLAPELRWSTIPMSFLIIGMAICGPLCSATMYFFGRKRGHQVGIVISLLGIFGCGYAISRSEFWVYCISNLVAGMGVAFNQQIRFTAAEESNDRKAEVHSTILTATLVSAFVGPGATSLGKNLFKIDFLGGLVLLSAIMILAFIGSLFLKTAPVESSLSNNGGVSISAVIKDRRFWIGAMVGMASFATMSLIMAATPIQMHHVDHFNHSDTSLAIQSHIFSMYFPSIFSGLLIGKLGIQNIIRLGISIFGVSLFVGWINHEFIHYWLSMVLLGIGWNFLFLAGSTWISTQFTGPNRYVAQGANDAFIFGTQALVSGLAGPMIFLVGWKNVLLIPIPILLLVLVFQWQFFKHERRASLG